MSATSAMDFGSDYMSWADPVSWAGVKCWDLGMFIKGDKNQLCDYT